MRRAEVKVQRLEVVVSTSWEEERSTRNEDYKDAYQATSMSANIPTYYEQSNNYHRVERQTWRERSGHGREEIWEKHGSILSKTGVGFHPILLPNMGIGDCFLRVYPFQVGWCTTFTCNHDFKNEFDSKSLTEECISFSWELKHVYLSGFQKALWARRLNKDKCVFVSLCTNKSILLSLLLLLQFDKCAAASEKRVKGD